MLAIVGAGFARTGTTSLKSALDALGYGPCYHMFEVFKNPAHIDVWNDAGDGKPVDWDALFDGYRAAIDYPTAHFWKELMTYYPDSKVILTVRDTDAWYQSISQTLFHQIADEDQGNASDVVKQQTAMAQKLMFQYLKGNATDPAHVKASFEASNQRIIDTVPANRLLVFDVAQGWEPLCEFLGCDVPDEPFPHLNTTKDFRKVRARLVNEGNTTDMP